MSVGRPRAFDKDHALEQALHLFWKKGYEGTSLDDLTAAMGINKPSLYSAFGNKEALFQQAMERYAADSACTINSAMKEPTAREATARLLRESIDVVTSRKNPRGCFMVQGALACSDDANRVQSEMSDRRNQGMLLLKERYLQAIKDGDLPAGTNASTLARYVAVVMHGLAVHAASGASRKELQQVAELVMSRWPGSGE
jgi:AcrR family transcriptional regulator